MSVFIEEFDYTDLHGFRYASEPTKFYYIPGAPTPQRDAQGQPLISLLKAGDKGFLQLTSQWCVSPEQMEELRSHLLTQFPDLAPETIKLSMAPATIHEVTLTLNQPDKDSLVLGTSHSSGYPPYIAAFSVTLDADQSEDVAKALSGEKDLLTVRYRGAVQKQAFSETSSALKSSLSQHIKTTHQLVKTSAIELEREADVGTWT